MEKRARHSMCLATRSQHQQFYLQPKREATQKDRVQKLIPTQQNNQKVILIQRLPTHVVN